MYEWKMLRGMVEEKNRAVCLYLEQGCDERVQVAVKVQRKVEGPNGKAAAGDKGVAGGLSSVVVRIGRTI
jgi:hypothetical protein